MACEPNLKLHVRLEDRVDMTKNAVQDALFTFDDGEESRGYRGTVASQVAGITYRQLDYWARKGIVVPSIKASHGSGSRRLYSFKDVVILAVSKRLLDAGVNLQNVTTALGYLSQRTADELEAVTIMCDGEHVYECTSDSQVVELMHGGKAVFGVSVRSLWHEIHDALEKADFVDVSGMSKAKPAEGNYIDELAERRMLKRMEAQKHSVEQQTA